ncbi:uncharacterized protein J4E78_002170 [Alternaria triticimaculans]|uniref:uncharacterized protein n=2 Tax=Alternaria sect. Infectoriae TaxID=2499258 RepID=UPI0020C21C3E|nr:uncharacterized protein J4E78_002170 [Alternaria triticimaculans]KAI4668344.1 hypothetical protein J4E78_002170 [Alternaria triticimaculans]
MTNDKAAPAFMDLPLEVRHSIFEHVAARDVKPKKLLRYWFEKKEVKELVAQDAIDNPNGPTPRVVYANDYDDHDDESAVSDHNSEEDDQEENEDAAEDSENEDEDEDEDGNEDEGADQEDVNDEDEAEDESESDLDGEDEDDEVEGAVAGAHDTQSATASVHVPAQATAQVDPDHHSEDGMAAEEPGQGHAGEGDSEDEGDNGEESEGAHLHNEDEAEGDSDGDEDLADDGGNAAATVVAAQPPPPAPVFRPHNKWRHIPNFVRITHCPPPVQLLLASRQLNNEAKNWFYDAFSQITDAAFSPMENIRKVDITFVWDSAWIRADTTDSIEAIFPALLRQRSNFVFEILLKAPDLREVVIHWHDSIQDDESANLMLDNLAPFHTLGATVNIIEHYIAADAKPKKRSIAGKRRVEFQNILDMGLDRLF